MDVDDSEAKQPISVELSNVEESAKWSAQGQFEQAKLWRGAHLALGVPAAALAAIAGATALASTTGRIAAGIIALVAAGLGAVASSLDAAGRAESAQTSGNRYLALQSDARVARDVDLPRQDVDTARQALRELMARRDEIKRRGLGDLEVRLPAGPTQHRGGRPDLRHGDGGLTMAWTTAAAFTEFLRKLELTDNQKQTVRSRRDTISTRLFSLFDSTSTMPVLRVRVIGSADRGTIIRPLDDVDLLAVFDADAYNNTYRWNSGGFITRVRDALNEGGASIVGTRGQAVRIFYTSGPKVDVAPVFALQGGGYFLPNGTGGWMTTNPDFHRDWIAERHRELNYHLKPLARAIKRWNRVHSERLSSFHIEVMVGRIFSSLGSDYRQAAAMFFTYASNYLHVNDPAGHSGDLAAKFTWNKQQAILQSFASARDRADTAVAAEARGDHAEAIRLWRIVFGDEFPSYG